MEGFVYVMSNPLMPGLVKVGMTEKMPHLRAAEISAHEGLPTQMRVEYYALVSGSPRSVERGAHRELSHSHAGKEWFKCDCAIAIAAVKTVAKDSLQHERYVAAERAVAEAAFGKQQQEKAEVTRKLAEAECVRHAHEETIAMLLRDFAELEPKAKKAFQSHTSLLRGIADGLSPITWSKDNFGTHDPSSRFERVELWPLEDILLVVKYHAAKTLLSAANRLPTQSWFEREMKGNFFLTVPEFVIQEFIRRLNLSTDKTPFIASNYNNIRNWYGTRTK